MTCECATYADAIIAIAGAFCVVGFVWGMAWMMK